MKQPLIRGFQKLLVRPATMPLFEHLYKLSLRGMGVLNSEGTEVTGERWLWHTFGGKLDIKSVVDVGANDGGLVNEMCHYFPKADFYCFEPNPETFEKLRKNTKDKTIVKKYNLAVSGKSGEMKLYDFGDQAALKQTQPTATMASVHKDVIEEFHGQPAKAYSVKAVSLDAWMRKEGLSQIDWLIADVEGHELAVLQGSKQLIKENAIGVFQFEFNEMNVYSRTFLRDFIKILPNYTFFRLLPKGLVALDRYRPLTYEIFGFQNIVAVKQEWAGEFLL